MFNFEKLEVWEKAIELADTIYRLTQTFPREEAFGLTSQIRRAAVSISSNIAEGSSRSSTTDFARFIEIATGSLFEVVSQSMIAQCRGYISEQGYRSLYEDAERIGRMASGLRHSLLAQ